MPTLATIGCFDGVHIGHRHLIHQVVSHAAERGLDPVALTFDQHPAVVLGRQAPLLLTTTAQKLQLLSTCGLSRAIVLTFDRQMAGLTAHQFIVHLAQRYDVRALVIGYDHHFGRPQPGEGFEQYCQYGRQEGVEVILATEFPDHAVSSTVIRRALLAGDVAAARRLLARHFVLQGSVCRGQQIGRTIGFCTANISVAPQLLVPATGVYATIARLADGTSCPAVTNIGHRPTVLSDGQITIETHLLDFAGDLYDQPLDIAFVSRIRDEQRFGTLQALREQIGADVSAARSLLLQYL